MSSAAIGFALLAVLFGGAAPLLDKLALREISPLTGMTVRVVAAAVMMGLYGLAVGVGKQIAAAPRHVLWYLVGSALLAAVLGQFAYYAAIKQAQASQVTPLTAAYPLVTLLLAVPLLREGLTVTKALGALLIVAGVILLTAVGRQGV